MPDALWKNCRRVMPWRRASALPSSLVRASTRRWAAVCRYGMNSSLETLWVGRGPGYECVSAGQSRRSSLGSSRDMADLLVRSSGKPRGLNAVGTQDRAEPAGSARAPVRAASTPSGLMTRRDRVRSRMLLLAVSGGTPEILWPVPRVAWIVAGTEARHVHLGAAGRQCSPPDPSGPDPGQGPRVR